MMNTARQKLIRLLPTLFLVTVAAIALGLLRTATPELPTSSNDNLAAAIAKVAPAPEDFRAQYKARLAAVTQGSAVSPAADTPLLNPREIKVTRTMAQALNAIGSHPLRSQLKAQLIADFVAEQGGIQTAFHIIKNPEATLVTFGADQASVRHLCLTAIEEHAREVPGEVIAALQSMAAHLVHINHWEKGIALDYRDLLYAYFKITSFATIEQNTPRFLADIGHNPQLASLIRSYVLQRYDSSIEEARLYPILRKIGGAS